MHNIARKLGYINKQGEPNLRRLIKTNLKVRIKTPTKNYYIGGGEHKAELFMLENRFGHLKDLTDYADEVHGRQKIIAKEQIKDHLSLPRNYRLRIPGAKDELGSRGIQILKTTTKGEQSYLHLKDGLVVEVLAHIKN